MLRKLRILFAVLFFCAVTALFVDFTGAAHAWFGWVAKAQFLPALMAANFAIVAALAVLTLLLGRIYCSVICPLGVFQDIVSYFAGRKKRNRFSHAPAKTPMRAVFLAAFAVLAASGFLHIAALVAPYSAFGRMASNFLAPLWALGNNLLSLLSEKLDSYAFYPVEVYFKGLGIFAVALATFAVVAVLAWRSGRTYCNTVCPVGTILGFLAKFSLFKPVIDTSKCNSCGLCARNCKAKCINSKEHKIDYSRCVDCFDCIGKCRNSAISYSARRPAKTAAKSAAGASPKNTTPAAKSGSKSNIGGETATAKFGANTRRGFFAAIFTLASTAVSEAAEKTVDGGLAPLKKRQRPQRACPITPPGSRSAANVAQRCTACQLCVSACPSHIIVASTRLSKFMQPELSYEHGYCAVECVECSKVCPAGAIEPITPAQKSSLQIGRAVWHSDRCIVNTDNMPCDNCFRQCPSGAISMVAKDPKNPKSPKVPVVDEARCLGCGTCENLCPARPLAAMCIEGVSVHNSI